MPPKSKNPIVAAFSKQKAPSKSKVTKPSDPSVTSSSQIPIVLDADSDDENYVTEMELEDEGEVENSFESTPSHTDGKRTRQAPKLSKPKASTKSKAKKVRKKRVNLSRFNPFLEKPLTQNQPNRITKCLIT